MENDEQIEKKLSEIPQEINGFKRRLLIYGNEPSINITIEYSSGGIYFGTQSLRNNVDLLHIATARNINDAVEEIKTFIDLEKRLSSSNNAAENFVYIENGLFDLGVTRSTLIKSSLTGTTIVPFDLRPPSFLAIYFMVQANGYKICFGRKGNEFFLQKNEHIVAESICENDSNKRHPIRFSWGIDYIFLDVSGKIQLVKTNISPPPNTLYEWSRKKIIHSDLSFTRPGKIYNFVKEALESLGDEISITTDISPFWDIQFDGKKITSWKPKHEPIITQHIESRLRDIALMNGFEIGREMNRGNGQLDLFFTRATNLGAMVRVCVEVKKCQADDLYHGLTVQLPEYMRRMSSDHGIYCIMFFGLQYLPNLQQFPKSTSTQPIDTNKLKALLESYIPTTSSQRISIVPIDISHKPSPSKM
jgi:hypothetical protein